MNKLLLQLKPKNIIDASSHEAKLDTKNEVNICSANGGQNILEQTVNLLEETE
jgi:hypothetical protein